MSSLLAAGITLEGSNYTAVIVVALIAIAALGVAGILVKEVLAADGGTENMQKIAGAVQEGAAAYLNRQFRTLGVFAVLVFFLLFLLPADSWSQSIGRSLFFLVGASFSAITGYVGMSLAVRGNVRVAAAARDHGEQKAMRIAFRTGGVAGMFTVGLGLLGASLVVLIYRADAPKVLEGFGFGAAMLAMFMRVVVASSRRLLTSVRISSARLNTTFPKMIPEMQQPSRTTSVTTSAIAQAWLPTSSSRTRSRLLQHSFSVRPHSVPSVWYSRSSFRPLVWSPPSSASGRLHHARAIAMAWLQSTAASSSLLAFQHSSSASPRMCSSRPRW